jgi:hypothetical protein
MIAKSKEADKNENSNDKVPDSKAKSSASSSFAVTMAYSYEPVETIDAIPAVVDIKAKKPKSSGVYNLDNIGPAKNGTSCPRVAPVNSVNEFLSNSF